jgi:hypothetical protein
MTFEQKLSGKEVSVNDGVDKATFLRFIDDPVENQDGTFVPITMALLLTPQGTLQAVYPCDITFTEDFASACKVTTKPDIDPASKNAESKEKYNDWLINAQRGAEELYALAKDAPAKTSVVCPTCRVMFQKNRAAQAFCGETQCKQDYWNLVRQKPRS